jgi:hypothetical protein
LNQGDAEAQEPAVFTVRSRLDRKNLQFAPSVHRKLQARSAPGRDTRSGQGTLARRHTDGQLWAALLKTTVMCETWRPRTIAPQILLELVQLLATSASPRAKVPDTDTGTGPIPPVTVSRVKVYLGGVLAKELSEGLRYLST